MFATATGVAGPAARLEQLVRAFSALQAGRPDLEVGARGTTTSRGRVVDTDRGVDLRLRCGRTGSTALLRVSRSGAALRAVSAVRSHAQAVSVLEDQLSVHLEGGYCWGSADFADADEMARALLSYMQARLGAVAAVCGPLPQQRLRPAAPVFRTGTPLRTASLREPA